MIASKSLNINLTVKTLLVFMFFFFLMHELHELAHIITGRLICSSWGTRDFNVWGLCDGCLVKHPGALAATFAGPAFTFVMLWIGRFLLTRGKTTGTQSVGLLFILGNMQFGRMYMAAMGSGDEVFGLRQWFLNQEHSNMMAIRIIGFLLVCLICIPPLLSAFRAISNKNKLLLFACFLIIPLILDTVVILIALNGLLQTGFLSAEWILGSPILITLWFLICAITVIFNIRHLTSFASPINNEITANTPTMAQVLL